MSQKLRMGVACAIAMTLHLSADAAPRPPMGIPFPNLSQGLVKSPTRGGSGMSKLSPELRGLYLQFARRGAGHIYSATQLRSRFGIASTSADPVVNVVIAADADLTHAKLAAIGASTLRRSPTAVYASVRVKSLRALVGDASVQSVTTLKAMSVPVVRGESRPARLLPRLPTRGDQASLTDFDHQGLTGKGVVVGIVDTGIDWKHADFHNPDGTSRILAIWDMTDQSWAESKGKIGLEPPIKDKDIPIGTVYVGDQLDAAMKGADTVSTRDHVGHGTACAGVAAGNGRGTGHGVPAGTYMGVAPEADLIIVKAGDGEKMSPLSIFGTQFIIDSAATLKEPCVINHSFGSQDSPHDGSDPEEAYYNSVTGAGKPGVVLCVSAGNDGRESIHARGRFGPMVDGQADVIGKPTEIYVTEKTEIDAYFSHDDEWGLAIMGEDHFFVTKTGKPDVFYLVNGKDGFKGIMDEPAKLPADFSAYFDTLQIDTDPKTNIDTALIPLPPGRYLIYGFGYGKIVPHGTFDFYLPFTDQATFGSGADKQNMVTTPGDAANVITVGAYYCRKSWANVAGKTTMYNLPLGDICDYSNPGYRRDGVVKPDLAAPATYIISTLASGSLMGKNSDGKADTKKIVEDGVHIAWSGTSSATPYTTGVIALMLQKNPNLDEEEIRQILISTTTKDDFTGATPNAHWGYGKLDPAAAIAAVRSL